MRIEPGTLAITFGAPMDNGLLVEVLERHQHHPTGGQLWLVQSQGSPFHITPTMLSTRAAWPESMLRPIGRPDDAAADETLAWKPVPLPTIELALLGVEARHA